MLTIGKNIVTLDLLSKQKRKKNNESLTMLCANNELLFFNNRANNEKRYNIMEVCHYYYYTIREYLLTNNVICNYVMVKLRMQYIFLSNLIPSPLTIFFYI